MVNFGPDVAAIERKVVYSIGRGWVETFTNSRVALAVDTVHIASHSLDRV